METTWPPRGRGGVVQSSEDHKSTHLCTGSSLFTGGVAVFAVARQSCNPTKDVGGCDCVVLGWHAQKRRYRGWKIGVGPYAVFSSIGAV